MGFQTTQEGATHTSKGSTGRLTGAIVRDNTYCERNTRGLRLLALDGISDTANLGTMIRCASAFGVDAVLLSPDCCDAWYRRAVRCSMGHIFCIPCIRVANLATLLKQLANGSAGSSGNGSNASVPPVSFKVTSYAAVIDRAADLVLEEVERGLC